MQPTVEDYRPNREQSIHICNCSNGKTYHVNIDTHVIQQSISVRTVSCLTHSKTDSVTNNRRLLKNTCKTTHNIQVLTKTETNRQSKHYNYITIIFM